MSAERNCPRKTFKSIRKTVWKTRKNDPKRVWKKNWAPLRPLKNISPALFNKFQKFFTAQNLPQKKSFFFTARLCRGGHANMTIKLSRHLLSLRRLLKRFHEMTLNLRPKDPAIEKKTLRIAHHYGHSDSLRQSQFTAALRWAKTRVLKPDTLAGEGANREKLSVKKFINAWRCFFHRLCPL